MVSRLTRRLMADWPPLAAPLAPVEVTVTMAGTMVRDEVGGKGALLGSRPSRK